MRHVHRTQVLAAVLLVLTQLHCATPAPSTAAPRPQVSPGELVEEAAAIIERESLDVAGVDWSAVRGAAPREVASLFLGDALVGRIVGRKEPAIELRAGGAAASVRWPLVVLVDEGTASAAELLAGALEANGRAVLMGARTFGKGRVHAPFPLKDGSLLLLTVGRIRTPSGRDILDEALEPSVRVPSQGAPGEDAAWQRALEWLVEQR